MKKKLFYIFILMLHFYCTSSCVSVPPKFQIEFDQDVNILMNDKVEKSVKRGERIEVSMKPMTFSQNNHKSVVLLPVVPNVGSFKIRLPKEAAPEPAPVATDTKRNEEEIRTEKGRDANKVARELFEIQMLLIEKRADEALIKVQLMRNRLPSFTYLMFLEASCFFVKRDFARAKSVAESALREFPDDVAGRQFLQAISDPGKTSKFTDKQGKEN